MENDDRIHEIIEILFKYEHKLSDGYEYYSTNVYETLLIIAKSILESLEKNK